MRGPRRQAGGQDVVLVVAGEIIKAGIAASKSRYVKPTVFAGVTPGMAIAREEIFGPVLCVLRYETEHVAGPLLSLAARPARSVGPVLSS